MPKRWCDQCSKSFASRQSLFKHKKRCTGNGLSIVTMPLPATISKNQKENLNRIGDTCHSENQKKELTKVLNTSDSEKNGDGDEMETTDRKSDDAEDVALWEKNFMTCNRGGKDIFEWLEDIIDLYIWSQKDKLFKTIMDDMVHAKKLGYSSSDACDYAVYKNKTDIVEAVKNCDDEDVFWCAFSNRDIQDGCLFTKVGVFVRMFYAMGHDKLIRKIVKDGDIGESIQWHRDEILDQYEQAQNLIKARGIDPYKPKFCDIESNGSGMYLNPYVVP